MNAPNALIDALREQVRWCDKLGSPFTARLLDTLVDDWLAGGPMHALIPEWTAGPPGQDLVPLRLAGGLHALALSGRHPALSALYPPAASGFDAAALVPLLQRLLVDEAEHLRSYLASAPQINEVMRSAVLIGGYAAVAQATGLPLAVREIGASAGLNLLWDRFHYTLAAQTWGDAASPVQIVSDWRGSPPTLYTPNGCARVYDAPGRILDIVNNYEKLSFNFGPTLLAWLEEHAPLAYQRLLAADRASLTAWGMATPSPRLTTTSSCPWPTPGTGKPK